MKISAKYISVFYFFSAKLIKFNSTKSSPCRTPKKQRPEKHRNLLDPTRLHPLPPNFKNREDEIISVDSRPTSLAISVLASDNETSV